MADGIDGFPFTARANSAWLITCIIATVIVPAVAWVGGWGERLRGR